MSEWKKIPPVPENDPIAKEAQTKEYWAKKYAQLSPDEFIQFSDLVCKKCQYSTVGWNYSNRGRATGCNYFVKEKKCRLNCPLQCLSDGKFVPRRGANIPPKDIIMQEVRSWCSSADCGNTECPHNLCHMRLRWFHHDVVLHQRPGCGYVPMSTNKGEGNGDEDRNREVDKEVSRTRPG